MTSIIPIIAVANQKGGVGKTAVTLGLASAASAAGLRTLVIDMDPQGNSTSGLGVVDTELNINDVLYADQTGVALDAVTPTLWPGVSVVPANLSLAQRDADQQLGAEMRLRKALDSPDLSARFDLVLIDCQPSVGKLVSNALIASTGVLIVTEPSIDASAGVANILNTIDTVREHYNPDLEVLGIVLNKVPPRSREADYRATELSDVLGDQLWEPVIPLRTVLAESRGARAPIHSYGSRATDLIAIFDAFLGRISSKG
ncbi:ParA family protein [Tomitella biformata]|uniref:ParA family protein n=1 Tax=Tomitella biformata TaxID=630403 RepID=UPI000688ECA4|nr:ParA family protein [Tomitella biformata]